MNVTREDVIRVLTDARNASEDRMPGQTRSEWEADALIAAFPHLVGEVTDLTGRNDPLNVPPHKKERTIYTVTGEWRESK